MKDLEIRGAGNLLGGEQSGHIEGVGFDLYIRLVGEAVADFRGDAEAPPAEVKIELPVDAHLPHDYVPGERLRLEAYKKLASVETDEGLAEIRVRAGRPLRRAAAAGGEPARGGPAAGHGPPGRPGRRRDPGPARAVRAGRPAREPAAAADPALPRIAGQAGAQHRARAAARRPPASAVSRCATARCWSGPGR